MITEKMYKSLACIITAIFIISSCNYSEPNSNSEFEKLPVADIELISEFDRVDDFYFQHLNYSTIPLSNGNIVINDREGVFLIEVNQQGELIRQISRDGMGPGEIQDPISIQPVSDSSLIMMDQSRQTIIRKTYDSSVNNEYVPPMLEGFRVSRIYPTSDPDIVSVHWWDPSRIFEADGVVRNIITSYNLNTENVKNRMEFLGESRARFLIDGRVVGAVLVPYTDKLLYDYFPVDQNMYAFWSGNSEIAVINPIDHDTLRTIKVNLRGEVLTSAERDSIQNEYDDGYWDSMRNLLPERKSPADKMIVDHEERIWLKLTLRSDYQEWIVLNKEGSPEFRIQFPKEGIVTHISEDHIGFRADDHIFSLYQLNQ